jgi:hypothetical protein
MSAQNAPERGVELVALSSASKPTQVEIVGDRIRVASLELVDRALAGYLEGRPADERGETVERALRVGLLALQGAGGSIDVDHVRRAFDAFLNATAETNKKAAEEVEAILRKTFATDGGQVPVMLERFIGDKGEIARFTKDLFDENRRDSALGRLNTILDKYFDGDASKLAMLLDPTRDASPLSAFRSEITKRFDEVMFKIVELDASQKAAKGERKKGTAKGADFESRVVAELTDLLRATNDDIEGTGGVTGAVPESKKGDAVITINAKDASATVLRIVVEVKDKAMTAPAIEKELAEARENRKAEIAMMVFSEAAAPAGIAPFQITRNGVFCAVDPEAPDLAILEAAYRLARISALIRAKSEGSGADLSAVNDAISALRSRLESVKEIKRTLTAIDSTTEKARDELDALRAAIVVEIDHIEEQVRASSAAAPAR